MTPTYRRYHRSQLAADASALSALSNRLVTLLRDLRFEAAQAEDAATAEALVELADELATAAHGPVSAVLVAHAKACDDAGMEPIFTADADLALTLGLKIETPLAGAQLQRAVDQVAAAFKPLVPAAE